MFCILFWNLFYFRNVVLVFGRKLVLNGVAGGGRGGEGDAIYVISYCSSMSKMLLSFAVLLSLICLPFLSPCSCSVSSVLRCVPVKDIMEILHITNTFTFALMPRPLYRTMNRRQGGP